MSAFRRIVHPSDFSPASRAALRHAIDVARRNRAELVIVHVLPLMPFIGDVAAVARAYDELRSLHRARGRAQLDRLVARAKAAGVRATGVLLDFGVAAELIVRTAVARRADLIVMGTHGRTGFMRALLGSVAARVIGTARCPVLTVRPR
jgi:nucleotide-binding universal stress UspA family protein